MNLIDNNIGNNFGTVNAAAVSQDKRKTNSKERTAECYGNEMFRIQFKRYFLKVSNADGVYGRSDECLYKKVSSEEEISGNTEKLAINAPMMTATYEKISFTFLLIIVLSVRGK